METGGRWAGWTFGLNQYVSSSVLRCIYRILSKKEAPLSKFGPTGVKSTLPHTSYVMLSKLCRPHPPRLHRHIVGARHLNIFEDLGLNFLGCTDSVEDGERLYTPVHRAAVQAAGKLPEGSLQPASPAVSSCALSCLPLCNAVGCIWFGGTPCALKTAGFCLESLCVFPVIH